MSVQSSTQDWVAFPSLTQLFGTKKAFFWYRFSVVAVGKFPVQTEEICLSHSTAF